VATVQPVLTGGPALCAAAPPHLPPPQPEMSHNVQSYDKQVYLRVSEAQRCRVHSTLVMPVFDGMLSPRGSASTRAAAAETAAATLVGGRGGGSGTHTPIAVFELVQADRDVVFPAVIAALSDCLQVRAPLVAWLPAWLMAWVPCAGAPASASALSCDCACACACACACHALSSACHTHLSTTLAVSLPPQNDPKNSLTLTVHIPHTDCTYSSH
jgi:hypothetical protein